MDVVRLEKDWELALPLQCVALNSSASLIAAFSSCEYLLLVECVNYKTQDSVLTSDM